MNEKDGEKTMKPRLLILSILLFTLACYLGIGLVFHLGWENAQVQCRESRLAQGEWVEPAVFWWPIRLLFTLVNWPVYTWANLYHDGVLFATPCTH